MAARGKYRGAWCAVALVFQAVGGFAEPAAPFALPSEIRPLGTDPFAAELGRALFEKLWVAAPSSTRGSDGLGPLYNARACSNCHENGGGAALPDREGPAGFGLVARFVGADGSARPHPQLGLQLQDRAITGAVPQGFGPEGGLGLRYSEVDGLRAVEPVISNADIGGHFVSLRIAPPLIGMAQIADIPEAEIIARADPEDADGDGISGRAGRAYSPDLGYDALARFGWRAESVTLRDQTAQAFSIDMGLSTPLYPDPQGDCIGCDGFPSGEDAGLRDGHEISNQALDLIVAYLSGLRPKANPAGAAIFDAAGCGGCHMNGYSTGTRPYSDFLLHDMGPQLADRNDMGAAGSAQWRTAPLWRAGHPARRGYLHDGRARTLLEAVLWHGGEAAFARDRVVQMSAPDRAALIEFLESL